MRPAGEETACFAVAAQSLFFYCVHHHLLLPLVALYVHARRCIPEVCNEMFVAIMNASGILIASGSLYEYSKIRREYYVSIEYMIMPMCN